MTKENVTPGGGVQRVAENAEVEIRQGSDMESTDKGASSESFDERMKQLEISKFMKLAQDARQAYQGVDFYSPVYDFVRDVYRGIMKRLNPSDSLASYAIPPDWIRNIGRFFDFPAKAALRKEKRTRSKAEKQLAKIQSFVDVDKDDVGQFIRGRKDDIPLATKDGAPIEVTPYPGGFEHFRERFMGGTWPYLIRPVFLSLVTMLLMVVMFGTEMYLSSGRGLTLPGIIDSVPLDVRSSLGAMVPGLFSLPSEWPTIFLYAFIHDNIGFFILNMLLLFVTCTAVEDSYGKVGYVFAAFVVLVTTAAASLLYATISGDTSLIVHGSSYLSYGMLGTALAIVLIHPQGGEAVGGFGPDIIGYTSYLLLFLTFFQIFASIFSFSGPLDSWSYLILHGVSLLGGFVAAFMMPTAGLSEEMRAIRIPVIVRIAVAVVWVIAILAIFGWWACR